MKEIDRLNLELANAKKELAQAKQEKELCEVMLSVHRQYQWTDTDMFAFAEYCYQKRKTGIIAYTMKGALEEFKATQSDI